MSSEVKKSKSKQEQSNIEVVFLNTAVNKDGQLLDDITQGRTILQYALDVDYINLTLSSHALDKDGNRYDTKTGLLISEKGKKEKPVNKKAKLPKEMDDNEK